MDIELDEYYLCQKNQTICCDVVANQQKMIVIISKCIVQHTNKFSETWILCHFCNIKIKSNNLEN